MRRNIARPVGAPPHRPDVVMIDSDARSLMAMTVMLSRMRLPVTAIQPRDAMKAAARIIDRHPRAVVVALERSCDLEGLRTLLASADPTRCIFLTPELRPPPTLSRIASAYGACVLSRHEAPAVLVATLIVMFAHGSDVVA